MGLLSQLKTPWMGQGGVGGWGGRLYMPKDIFSPFQMLPSLVRIGTKGTG